jgi:hypothetical protein
MRLHHTLFLLLLFSSASAFAYELLIIQGVSETKRTFITRNGKRQGIVLGMQSTFTAEDASFLARAINVTGEFTQWELVNKDARLPFEKGTIVTWSPAQEYLWALNPEKERRKYIKSQMRETRNSWVFKGALTRGLSETTSNVANTSVRRGGYLGEVYYEKGLTSSFAMDFGLRYERETVNYVGVSYTTQRNLGIVNLLYYFDQLREFLSGGRVYLGGGFGYGLSNTQTVGLSQTGPVMLLPTVKLGLSLPFSDLYEFLLDGAFESLQTSEEQSTGNRQVTTQTNFKVGFGLRRFF